jgi:hypothetical protein
VTVLGKEHPSTLTSINNLAAVMRDQGKYEQALSKDLKTKPSMRRELSPPGVNLQHAYIS